MQLTTARATCKLSGTESIHQLQGSRIAPKGAGQALNIGLLLGARGAAIYFSSTPKSNTVQTRMAPSHAGTLRKWESNVAQ